MPVINIYNNGRIPHINVQGPVYNYTVNNMLYRILSATSGVDMELSYLAAERIRQEKEAELLKLQHLEAQRLETERLQHENEIQFKDSFKLTEVVTEEPVAVVEEAKEVVDTTKASENDVNKRRKYGGRKKGSKNKSTLAREAAEKEEAIKLNNVSKFKIEEPKVSKEDQKIDDEMKAMVEEFEKTNQENITTVEELNFAVEEPSTTDENIPEQMDLEDFNKMVNDTPDEMYIPEVDYDYNVGDDDNKDFLENDDVKKLDSDIDSMLKDLFNE